MATARPAGLTELARFGFEDLTGAISGLERLVEAIGDLGHTCLAHLGRAQNPDQALRHLIRLASENKSLTRQVLRNEESAARLILILGASDALADFLHRQPNAIQWLENRHAQLVGQESMASVIRDRVKPQLIANSEIADAWTALRIAYREQLLRVAAFDLQQSQPVANLPKIAAELADLAGAALEVALEIARFELGTRPDFGRFEPTELAATELAVIGMGKAGARELNYISDVDVIFVAESSSAELDSQRAVEIATKLATRMMRAIDGTAAEPALWQVDANLRPEGKSGALVRTLESHLSYYDRWAESWEFQALLKARPLAGNFDLGERYVTALAPKVWSSSKRDGFVESVQKMRQRVTDNIPTTEVDRQIKLGPGGLRDVEFTVQLLQIVHGRTDESIRVRDTVGALSALSAASYIGRSEASQFAEHYRFLRFLEHRIQLSQMRRTHLMPTEEGAQRSIARAVNLKYSAKDLLDQWESVKLEVRSLHQKLFFRPLLSSVSKLDDETLELSSDQAQDRLAAIGFADPRGALGHIGALTSGLSRRAAIQKQLLPVLIQWFSQGSDPDAALLAFRRLSEDLGDSPWYLRMLRDSSGAAERMTQVLANSKYATALFERMPEAAAWFDRAEELNPLSRQEIDSELLAIVGRHDQAEPAAAAIRAVRRRETLRIAMGAVLGQLDLRSIEIGLSDLFDSCLNALQILAIKINAVEELDLSIVAMGRYGGRELGFGSDADVVFVYSGDPEKAQAAAEIVVSEIRKFAVDPQLEFELDLDLRPEGKKGPIVRSLDSYRNYFERWASTWEFQALLRARAVTGSAELRQEFTELIDKFRYPEELTASQLTEIRRIKARVETERLPQGADPLRHLKLGRGSISDVEWAVQLMQLQFGQNQVELRTVSTLEALEELSKLGKISPEDAAILQAAWLIASRIRSALVLWTAKKTDVLPLDRKQLAGAARLLGYPDGLASQLEEDYLAATRRARAVFDRVFYG